MVTGQRPVSPILASLEPSPDAPLAASHGRETGLPLRIAARLLGADDPGAAKGEGQPKLQRVVEMP